MKKLLTGFGVLLRFLYSGESFLCLLIGKLLKILLTMFRFMTINMAKEMCLRASHDSELTRDCFNNLRFLDCLVHF